MNGHDVLVPAAMLSWYDLSVLECYHCAASIGRARFHPSNRQRTQVHLLPPRDD
jgi:hypothetical protein